MQRPAVDVCMDRHADRQGSKAHCRALYRWERVSLLLVLPPAAVDVAVTLQLRLAPLIERVLLMGYAKSRGSCSIRAVF